MLLLLLRLLLLPLVLQYPLIVLSIFDSLLLLGTRNICKKLRHFNYQILLEVVITCHAHQLYAWLRSSAPQEPPCHKVLDPHRPLLPLQNFQGDAQVGVRASTCRCIRRTHRCALARGRYQRGEMLLEKADEIVEYHLLGFGSEEGIETRLAFDAIAVPVAYNYLHIAQQHRARRLLMRREQLKHFVNHCTLFTALNHGPHQ
mmetsp:Transcript_62899/g.101733  ORF Transcript_62899/g.101733 Transcript_62899/m.101733 type:complete len:202 (+) Transcript_62899:772-1377(+)